MLNEMYSSQYNPDVLSCLANLSNDEVFTPPELVNQMLDLLPDELWRDSNARFLDPCTKSGVFLREIAKRLLIGLENEIPDLQQRIDHIFKKQIFGIAITELTSLMSRRSTYCSKYPNGPFSVCDFSKNNIEGNIRFKKIKHTWRDKKCIFCGATQSEYDRGESLETHAYEFIHTNNPEGIWNMKFDVIVGNPPYQLSDGGHGVSAKPIYHLFVEQAKKLNPRYLTMIIPARWYAGGKGLNDFRKEMLLDRRISHLYDFSNSNDCFSGVTIAGGVCYFLWDRTYDGECLVGNYENNKFLFARRSLSEFPIFVRDNLAIKIIHHIQEFEEKTFDEIVKSRNSFGLPSNFKSAATTRKSIPVLSSSGIQHASHIEISDRDNILEKYKVIINYAMSGGNKPSSDGDYMVLSSLKVIPPGEAFTETYLCVDAFDDVKKAENLISFLKTKFCRFLLLQALTSIHITKDKFIFVPHQDFSEAWTDEKLYQKYNLGEDEINFIETMIKPMEDE